MANVSLPAHKGTAAGNAKCPFCKDPPKQGYNTKRGNQKNETHLGENLAAPAKPDVTTDKVVGKVYPLPGGNDPTQGWIAEKGALVKDHETFIICTPHHLIPGKAAMAKSRLEKWTKK